MLQASSQSSSVKLDDEQSKREKAQLTKCSVKHLATALLTVTNAALLIGYLFSSYRHRCAALRFAKSLQQRRIALGGSLPTVQI